MEHPVIYTLGYRGVGADEKLERLIREGNGIARPVVRVMDIRLSPRSRFFPLWRKKALTRRLADRYSHIPALGNLHYRDHSLPIELAEPDIGIRVVLDWLDRGDSVCLLCACAHVESCHRRLVAALLVQHGAYEVVHL